MKIKLYFEKENLIRLAVAMVFAAVLFAVIRFPIWVLLGFGVLYFGIKSLKIELNENWTFVLSVVQIISWLGYTNLSELEKRYKIVISAFTIVAVCIIGLFYFLK